jgi:hypothetical protein
MLRSQPSPPSSSADNEELFAMWDLMLTTMLVVVVLGALAFLVVALSG